ncbi:hypothetical protein VIGAN_01198200, partial [Vigna angularis var. angularis]
EKLLLYSLHQATAQSKNDSKPKGFRTGQNAAETLMKKHKQKKVTHQQVNERVHRQSENPNDDDLANIIRFEKSSPVMCSDSLNLWSGF